MKFQKGHQVPKEWRDKLSNLRKKELIDGTKLSCKKCGDFLGKYIHTCKQVWNKGLTKKDKRVAKNIQLMLQTRKRKNNYKHTEETKNKITDSIKELIAKGGGNPFKEREKNIAWNGGTSFEPYGKGFNNRLRLYIKKRDNFSCQECRFTEDQLGETLHVHHIDYNKKNNNPKNLISLCISCHMQTNFNREDWSKYFQEKIKNG